MGTLSGVLVLLLAVSPFIHAASVKASDEGRRLSSYESVGGIECKDEAFKCNDGRCIPKTWKCDGDYDCLAHEDEADCDVEKCGANEFKCGRTTSTSNPLKAFPMTASCIPEKWRCDGEFDCEDQSDEDGCETVQCKDNQFTCTEFGGKFKLCIPKTWMCDGQKDCASGADEENCEAVKKCEDDEFDCGNGVCIFGSWKCDGEDDCGNNRDEQSCPADKMLNTTCSNAAAVFNCETGGNCIPKEWRCDGEADCHDRSDEKGCAPTTTQCKLTTEFACKSGHMCINKLWQCDGEKDCPDGSDEGDCEIPATCKAGLRKCSVGGFCIPESLWCNGADDCPDGGDELNCDNDKNQTTRVCEEGHDFTCPQMPAICVPYDKLCTDNTHFNCGDDTLCNVDNILCEPGSHQCECRNGTVKNTRVCHCNRGFTPVGKVCQDVNECLTPGRCDQICTNVPGSYKCSCHPSYSISFRPGEVIASKCRAMGEDPLVLLSNRATIRQYDLTRNEHLPLINSPGSAVAMDFHMKNGTLIWSDIALRKIMMCEIGNTNVSDHHHLTPKDKCGQNEQTVVVEGDVHTPDGLAVDWVHNLLFWTDGALDTVSVMDLETRRRRVLFNDDLEEPRAIAVDPEMGLIFWTDWGKEARIERAGMDGEHRKVILTGAYIKWPNGLALDLLSKRLYWADAKVKSIYSSDYFGQDVKVVLHSHAYLRHPFSLAVFEDRVFFTDWEHDGVISVNKFTGSDVSKLMTSVSTPMTVRIYHQVTQPDHPDKCKNNMCGESLCLPRAMIQTAMHSGEDPIRPDLPFSCVCEGDALSDKFACLATAMVSADGFSLPTMLLFLLLAVSAVGGYVFYRQRRSPSRFSALHFDNPVYRRTTEPETEEFRGTVGMEDIEVPVHPARIALPIHDDNSMIESLHQPLTT